jgi:hypothetical protein
LLRAAAERKRRAAAHAARARQVKAIGAWRGWAAARRRRKAIERRWEKPMQARGCALAQRCL